MKPVATALLFLLAACAHTGVSVNSGAPPASGTHVVSNGAGLHVNASGGVAAAIVAAGIIAGAAQDLREPEPMPRYWRFSDGFWSRPAPELDPTRSVTEQDCTKPIEGSGNLKCR